MKQYTVREFRSNLAEALKNLPCEVIDGVTKKVLVRLVDPNVYTETKSVYTPEKVKKWVEVKVEKCEWPRGCSNLAVGEGAYTDWDATYGEDKTVTLQLCQFHLDESIKREAKYKHET